MIRQTQRSERQESCKRELIYSLKLFLTLLIGN